MKVIVIIVTYNGIKWYDKCFQSLRDSTTPIQTLVIDNKSTDNTVEYIKENFPEIILIESATNLGFGKANNIGFKYAIEQNADFVFLLNQDASVKNNTIDLLIKKMTASPEYGILSPIHLAEEEDKLDNYFRRYIEQRACPDLVSDMLVKGKPDDQIYPIQFVNAALWLVSINCIKTIGGFNSIFPHYGEDDNYLHRLEFHGFKAGVYPLAFGVHYRLQREEKRPTFKQKKHRDIISNLIILTDIRQPLKRCILSSFFQTSLKMYNNLLHLAFKELIANCCAFLNIITLYPKILKNRKMSKLKGTNFL